MDALPLDAWMNVQRGLDQRDLAALACCSSGMRDMVDRIVTERGIRVKHQNVGVVAKYPDVTALTVRGLPARFGSAVRQAMGVLSLPGLPRLTSLTLHHPRLPDAPFWPVVFARCPALRHVRLINDFYMSSYAKDVRHAVDLYMHGAPRLTHLDIEGGWLVLYRIANQADFGDAAAAIEAAHTMPPVPSSILTRLRTSCRQIPMTVDAPLTHLEIEEPHEKPFVAGRMGPLTLQSVEHLVWKACWPAADAGPLGRFANLRVADIHLLSVSSPSRMESCLRTLAALPRTLRRLTLHLDLWMMRTYDSYIAWGDPLAHLDLEHLEFDMLFPPSSIEDLLGGWLGAGGPAMRTAFMRFRQSAAWCIEEELEQVRERGEDSEDESVVELKNLWEAACRPVYGCRLSEWLDESSVNATAVMYNFDKLVCKHRRCTLV